MRRVASLPSLLLPILLAACKPEPASVRPDAADAARGEAELASAEPPQGPAVRFASAGVPHTAAITLVALDPAGAGALTRDALGGVRLWPALDGSREPLVVPIRDPRAMALAARGEGWTLALLDGAGGARIVGVDAAGGMQPLASLPPTDPLSEILVLPGGDRLLAVGSDHVIRLLDPSGEELARLDVPGLRPASLRIAIAAEGGPKVIALSPGEFDNEVGRFAVELIPLELGPSSVAQAGTTRVVHIDSPATIDNPTISPDGRTAVYLRRNRLGRTSWHVRALQLDDGREVSVDSEEILGQQPRIGLLANGRVLLDNGTGLGRVVDLRAREVELIPLRSSPTINHLAASFAGGLRVAPAGTWLAVHELGADDLRYLGYEQINVSDAGLSPSGARVAWALADRVLVEGIGGAGEVFEVPGTRPSAQRFVGFVDEELLLTLDWAGGAKLLRWRDGELVDAADLGAQAQTAELARDGQGNGALLVRTQLWETPTIVALREREIGPRYIAHAAGNLVGVLAPSAAPLAEWGAWTLDNGGGLRRYRFAELEQGLTSKAALAAVEAQPFGVPEQLAIDGRGRKLWIRTTGPRPTLSLDGAGDQQDVELAPGFAVFLRPSPDARRIAVIQQRDSNQVLTVLDGDTLATLWAQPLSAANGLSWSDAGERLAVATTVGGGVVFAADDGSPELARCGLAFEVRRSPPDNPGFFPPLSVCAL